MRSLYLSMAVAGMVLVVGAGAVALVAYVPPGDTTVVAGAEIATVAVGIVIAWAGLVQAREAGDGDVRLRGRRRRRKAAADALAAAVPEVAFSCPECGRGYRAAGSVAGRPFACRVCDARFTVPRPATG